MRSGSVSVFVGLSFVFSAGPVAAADPSATQPKTEASKQFGAMPGVSDISLSPDGKRIAYIAPGPARSNLLYVAETTEAPTPKLILKASGDPEQLLWCRWKTGNRLICNIGVRRGSGRNVNAYLRTVAVDADGSNLMILGTIGWSGNDVIDWLVDDPENVLMQLSNGSVSKVNVSNNRMASVYGNAMPAAYVSDGNGTIRLMLTQRIVADASFDLNQRFYFRDGDSWKWTLLSTTNVVKSSGFRPVAVDKAKNRALGFAPVGGFDVAVATNLDAVGQTEVLYREPGADVDQLILMGRRRQFVGVSFATDRRKEVYFDDTLKRYAASLGRALGDRDIHFVDQTDDGQKYLVWAGSDIDPGTYYLFSPAAKKLQPLLAERGDLASYKLSTVQSVRYPASDGTMVPGYLTLPPGRTDARGLPAIVMPHGGPSARDEWGFDWVAQFLAQSGYAVLQPNFRGSSGYGDKWYQKNGFQSWRIAVGDIVDAGRWLVSDRGADGSKLSIVGWSYGGYAALQSAVLAPGLFRSVVAIAPVTDLAQLKREESRYITGLINSEFVGDGPHIREGSPARNASAISVPVLMFHGTLDTNVDVDQARTMKRELEKAGRPVELIEYPGLAHSLETSEARSDMLKRISAFLPH